MKIVLIIFVTFVCSLVNAIEGRWIWFELDLSGSTEGYTKGIAEVSIIEDSIGFILLNHSENSDKVITCAKKENFIKCRDKSGDFSKGFYQESLNVSFLIDETGKSPHAGRETYLIINDDTLWVITK